MSAPPPAGHGPRVLLRLQPVPTAGHSLAITGAAHNYFHAPPASATTLRTGTIGALSDISWRTLAHR